jgi:hypothetical protein
VLGFEIRAVGANARAAAFAGVPVTAHRCWWRCCRARWPGLAGAIEVAGRTGYVTLDMSPGYGYSGIVIAMLAGLHPLGVVAASVFVAGMLVGADSMSRAGGRAHLHRRRDRRRGADRDAGGHLLTQYRCAGNDANCSTCWPTRALLGGGAAHRHAADPGHAGRAAVRTRRRAEPGHRGHHGRRRLHRLAGGVRRRAAVGRRGVAALTGAGCSACCTAC